MRLLTKLFDRHVAVLNSWQNLALYGLTKVSATKGVTVGRMASEYVTGWLTASTFELDGLSTSTTMSIVMGIRSSRAGKEA